MSPTDNRPPTTDYCRLKIAFHSSYLGYRGTEIALMDYAQGNNEVLGNQSFFLMPWREGAERHPVTQRMKSIAPLRFYKTPEEREGILKEEKADYFYCIKNGFNDGAFSKKVPTGVHAIFRESEFHGDVYAYVSPWLSEVMAYGKAPWVPHMVNLAKESRNLRAEFGIAQDTMVFGRHGGDDSFDIRWVQRAVVKTAKERPDIWFLFMNTRPFPGAGSLPNIRFLPATADPIVKKKFLNTCDAMLHARIRGETFGLSCLEFALLGKPVLTYAGSPEKAHLQIASDWVVPYQNDKEIKILIKKFNNKQECKSWTLAKKKAQKKQHTLSENTKFQSGTTEKKEKFFEGSTTNQRNLKIYQPIAVMKQFQKIFLQI